MNVQTIEVIATKKGMTSATQVTPVVGSLLAGLLVFLATNARADAITDWNIKTSELITEAKIGTPPAVRIMALVQTAAYSAGHTINQRQPAGSPAQAADRRASIDAAVAAAHRVTLLRLLPAQRPSIEAAYQTAVAPLADEPTMPADIVVGEKAAADVLAQRLEDGTSSPEAYRTRTTAGTYVPTAAVFVPQWPQRKPWLMTSAAQFRPAAPLALDSAQWLSDFDEVKDLGGKTSTRRSAEQTEVARFWEYSLPAIYFGVLRSVALQPGRDVTRNAQLFALTAQAMDDALIGVFEAKYHYNFWRPVTAIRNADIDGHEGTQREAAWVSLIEAPLHPEYPSAHSVLAAAVGAVLKAEVGQGPMPMLTTTSPTAQGATRRWPSVDEFVREVSDARVWGGIHFRAATKAGEAMGQRVGELAAQRLRPAP
jgi:PAP2 superfamily